MAHEGYYSDSANLTNVNDALVQSELYKNQAQAAASSATTSAATAASAATTATTKAAEAVSSAAAALSSESTAVNSATTAAASSASASTSASNAATSESNAATSASNAASTLANALVKTNNLSDVTNVVTARSNLGLVKQTSASDTTTGAVLTQGAFNLGIGNFAKNAIINGRMDLAQGGTSFPAIVNGAYSLDQWQLGYVSSAVITTSQQLDATFPSEFQYCLQHQVTTADASIAAGDACYAQTQIEGYNARQFIGKPTTLSFWVRSAKTGVHCIQLLNGVGDRSYVLEYTVAVANTPQKVTVSVPNGLITAGTWNWTNGSGLVIRFALSAGTTFQTSPNAWQTGNFLATTNQVNVLDTVGNIFAITGVQLEVGSVATTFEHRPYWQELALCQRYYQIVGNGFSGAANGSTTSLVLYGTLPVTMRANPTFTGVAGAGAGGVVRVGGTNETFSGYTSGSFGVSGGFYTVSGSGYTLGNPYIGVTNAASLSARL
jgi:hypothetical protein